MILQLDARWLEQIIFRNSLIKPMIVQRNSLLKIRYATELYFIVQVQRAHQS